VAHPRPPAAKRAALDELIRLTAEAGAPVPSHELPLHLYVDLLHHCGGIQKARRAAGLPDPAFPRRWNEAEVIEEIRRVYRSGITIRFFDLERAGREDLVGAIRTYVGSIVRARRLARVPHPPRRGFEVDFWDEDRVIEDILEIADAGGPLAYSKAPPKLVNAGSRYFGSWAGAIEAAGLDYEAIRLRRKPYDDAAMLERIRVLAAEHPEMTVGQLYGHADGQAIMRRFPSIEDAVKRAGVTGWPIRLIHDLPSKAEVIAALQTRHRQGAKLTKTAFEQEDQRLLNAIRRHFRTVERALKTAGLESEIPQFIRWTRAEVLKQLRRRRDAGLPLHASAVQDDMSGLYPAAVKFFGTYMAAAARFGARPRQESWTPKRVLEELRTLAAGRGVVLTAEVPDSLLHACARYYGSLEKARRAAGLRGLRGHRWSRDAIIADLKRRASRGQPITGNALGSSLMTACWRYFGSLDAALAAAGLSRPA
jgi:hypothetical protein